MQPSFAMTPQVLLNNNADHCSGWTPVLGILPKPFAVFQLARRNLHNIFPNQALRRIGSGSPFLLFLKEAFRQRQIDRLRTDVTRNPLGKQYRRHDR